jgi:hypothetical protein
VDKPRPIALVRKTQPQVVQLIDELLQTCTDVSGLPIIPLVRPELPTAACVRRKRRPPPWTTLHRRQPARSPLKNRGKLFKQAEPLLTCLPTTATCCPWTAARQSGPVLRMPMCAARATTSDDPILHLHIPNTHAQ